MRGLIKIALLIAFTVVIFNSQLHAGKNTTDQKYIISLSEKFIQGTQQNRVCFVPEQRNPGFYAKKFFPNSSINFEIYPSEGYWFVITDMTDLVEGVIVKQIASHEVAMNREHAGCMSSFSVKNINGKVIISNMALE